MSREAPHGRRESGEGGDTRESDSNECEGEADDDEGSGEEEELSSLWDSAAVILLAVRRSLTIVSRAKGKRIDQ